jgi:hypothetical protein
MTTIQTIHIDSSYRNRIEYPNPADFVVPYGSPVGNTLFSMTNPVTNELPVYNLVFPLVPPYNYSIDFTNGTSPIANSSLKVTISSWNTNKVILDAVDVNTIFGVASSEREHDFLRNLYFVYGVAPSSPPYTIVRIIGYDSLTYTLTLASPVQLNLAGIANYCYLYNDSNVTSTDFSILLTGSLTSFQNNYVRKNQLFLYNASRNEQVPVLISDDGMYINNLTTGQYFSGWTVNDFYILFNNQSYIRRLLAFPDGKYYSWSVANLTMIETSTGFPMNHSYTLYQLDDGLISTIEILITSIDFQGRIREWTITKRGYGIQRGRSYYVQGINTNGQPLYAVFRADSTYQSFLIQGSISISPNEFFTPLAFSPLYNHDFAFVNDEITYNVFPTVYGSYDNVANLPYNQLQNMTGSSMIYGNEFMGGNTMVFTTSYEESLLTSLDSPFSNSWWNTIVFSTVQADQYVPLNYSGSTVSQEQLVCYEIELLNLILPNLELNTTRVLTSFYPYIFVEFSNTSSFIKNVNALYTNNQYGQSALFAVPISDVNSPEISQFLNLNNCKSIQTIKFKPNDSIHFRVFLTNGETFTPYLKDTIPPMLPNPLVQITAMFSIRRV